MDCAKARFLLYTHLDREPSGCDAEALARHLAECPSCEIRSRAARGLARLLHSRLDRTTAPHRLRMRLQQAAVPQQNPRSPAFAMAAAILILVLPLVADDSARKTGSLVSPAGFFAADPSASSVKLVSRLVTGTLICLQCEARHEAGLCPLPEKQHEAALCADDGQVWRLMSRDPSFGQSAVGQTVTVEGIAFPQSGFLRASRVGY